MTIRSITATALAIIVCTVVAQTSNSQTVRYRASGTDAVFNPFTGDYVGRGTGLHLGLHTIAGNVGYTGTFDPEPGVFFRGSFSGSQTVTAANGATITMDLSGDVELLYDAPTGLVTGLWFPTFEVTGGTGRFANASGSMSGVAINPPFNPGEPLWPFDWFINGTMDLGRGK